MPSPHGNPQRHDDRLLPGFAWPLTAGGFLIGLLWLIRYSLYAAALIALPYNYFVQRENHA
ncbi:MAG: hypothetical protein Q7J80_09335 [Anaerolineales bacterium]|nr:hypothetical protein [Anaerolineales bacterium]